MHKLLKSALINASCAVGYIILVGLFMYYGSLIKLGKVNTFLAPITFLLLFVFSATLTGYLILGKPALLYIDGKKKEALSLLAYTLGILFGFTFLAVIILISLTLLTK